MSTDNKQHFDEELSRVFLSFEKDLLPSDEIKEEILGRLRDKIRTQKIQHSQHYSRWKKHLRIRIPLATAASLLLFFGLWWLLVGNTSTASADFGEMLDRIRQMTSVIFDVTHQPRKGIKEHAQVQMSLTGKTRQVWDDGKTCITDTTQGKCLVLTPSEKRAFLRSFTPGFGFTEPLETLRNSADSSGQFVRSETENGREIQVYEVLCDKGTMTVWVDREQQLPIRIQRRVSCANGDQIVSVLENFRWNSPVSETLFAMDIPEGYVLESLEDKTTKENLLFLLQFCAQKNGGIFPDKLNTKTFIHAMYKKSGLGKMHKTNEDTALSYTDQPTKLIGRRCIAGLGFIKKAKADGLWQYVGNGIHLGDKNSIVCYWKAAGSNTVTVVFGDLTIRKLPIEELPSMMPDTQ